jgi:O-antigen ligase
MAARVTPPRSAGRIRTTDVQAQIAHDAQRSRMVYAVILAFSAVIAAIAYSSAPEFFSVALLVLLLACIGAFLRPTVGLYLLVFLTMVGDAVTMTWWPFTKNMSSHESILFVNDQLFVNPLEVVLGVTLLAWLMHSVADPTWTFKRGRLFWPLTVFTFFVIAGYARGLASGGDKRIAIFEGRALLYIYIVYVLATNLLTTRRQYVRLVLMAFAGIAVQSIFALQYYRGLSDETRTSLESLGEHSATVAMDAVLILLISVFMLKCSRWLRWTMLVLAPPVVYAYILSQRRAAMVALFVGIFIVIAVMFERRRRAFWVVAPTVVLLGAGLVAATWNATGAISLPAQAVKTVLFPDQLTERNSSSDLYRRLENFNLYFTIRNNRLFGVGFGNQFLRPLSMPDISFFEFWQYIPHNNVLWIWIKMGFLGFASMLFLFGRAVQLGARSIALVRSSDHVAFVLVGLTYVIMFLVFAYVDIAWDARCTVLLGVAMALCADFVQARDTDATSRPTMHFEMVPQ